MIAVLRAADRIAMPWKNGGGVTREVAIWPPGSDVDTFDWRVSIAEVREAGPFSCFENIDRTLAVLQGHLRLTFAGSKVELDQDHLPVTFRGEIACSGTPVTGPVTDLNVMTRRGRARARLKRFLDGTLPGIATTTLLLARSDTHVQLDGQTYHLQPLDGLFTDRDSPLSLAGEGYLIAIA